MIELCNNIVVLQLAHWTLNQVIQAGLGHCIMFLGKTLHSHRDSLHPGVQKGTGKFNAAGSDAPVN